MSKVMSILCVLVFSLSSFALSEGELGLRCATGNVHAEQVKVPNTCSTDEKALRLFLDADVHPLSEKRKDLRKGTEIEATKKLQCKVDYSPKDFFNKFFLPSEGKGEQSVYENFLKLGACKLCEAYSTYFPLDEIPWNEKSHELRELNPYVWVSIEKNRFFAKGKNKRKLVYSKDLMDDFYFDTKDYILSENNLSLRGRRRWQSWKKTEPPEIEGVLVAVKENGGIDPQTGLKTSKKTDDRTRISHKLTNDEAYSLVEDVRNGYAPWVKRVSAKMPRKPLESIAKLYSDLSDAGKLPSYGKYKDVLALEDKIFVRSLRARFHYIETPVEKLKDLYALGEKRVVDLLNIIEDVQFDNPEAEKLRQALEAKLKGFDKVSSLVEAAKDRLVTIDPDYVVSITSLQKLHPRNSKALSTDLNNLKLKHEFAKILNEQLHEIAKEISILKEEIAQVQKKDVDLSFIKTFTAWQLSSPSNVALGLGRKTTKEIYISIYERLLGALGPKKLTEKLNKYGNKNIKGYKSVKTKDVKILGKALFYKELSIWVRQIEAAGSVSLGLWFDQARAFYVPESTRVTEEKRFDHFLIDTFDFSHFYDSKHAWVGYAPHDRNNLFEPNEESFLDAVIINEVQIELGKEAPYTKRIAELRELVGESPEERPLLDGAIFIFDQYKKTIEEIAEIKKDDILDFAKEEAGDLCTAWSWENATESKGELSIKLSKKLEGGE